MTFLLLETKGIPTAKIDIGLKLTKLHCCFVPNKTNTVLAFLTGTLKGQLETLKGLMHIREGLVHQPSMTHFNLPGISHAAIQENKNSYSHMQCTCIYTWMLSNNDHAVLAFAIQELHGL